MRQSPDLPNLVGSYAGSLSAARLASICASERRTISSWVRDKFHLAADHLFPALAHNLDDFLARFNRRVDTEQHVHAGRHKVRANRKAFSLIHSGAMPTPGMSLMSSPSPPSVAISVRTVRMRDCPRTNPYAAPAGCQSLRTPRASRDRHTPSPLRREQAVLGIRERAATGLDHQDVVLQEFLDDVVVALVVRDARIVAPNDAGNAAQTTLHHRIVERAERAAQSTAQHIADVLVRKTGHQVVIDTLEFVRLLRFA
jgi:hypothetical protein